MGVVQHDPVSLRIVQGERDNVQLGHHVGNGGLHSISGENAVGDTIDQVAPVCSVIKFGTKQVHTHGNSMAPDMRGICVPILVSGIDQQWVRFADDPTIRATAIIIQHNNGNAVPAVGRKFAKHTASRFQHHTEKARECKMKGANL